MVLSVTNKGSDPAETVSGETSVGSPQLDFASFVAISQGAASRSIGGPVLASFGTIAAGSTATLKWVENDVMSGLGSMTANFTTSTAESSTANNSATATIDVLALRLSEASLSFGSQVVGGIGPAKPLTVTNDAAIPVAISRVALAGEDFVTSTDGCAGITLAVGASCQVAARFAPAALGDRTGSVTVESSTVGVSPVEASLTGTGTEVIQPVSDVTVPTLALAGVPKSIDARRFRKGFAVKVSPSEPVSLETELLGNARKGALASALELRLFGRSLPLAGGTRTIRVKPKGSLLGPLRRKLKVQLRVEATDAAGNRSTTTRSINVKPSRRHGKPKH